MIDIRKDTDGEILYGVAYSDTDYEEMSFKDVVEVLQPYDPLEDDDDVLEITPFFGSSKRHLAGTDSTADPPSDSQGPPSKSRSKQAPTNTTSDTPNRTEKSAPRRSTRVRVVRRPHNVGKIDISEIPSSQNKRRLRSAMSARTDMFNKVMALASRCHEIMQKERRKPVPTITIPPGTYVDQLPPPKNYDDAILGPYRNYWIPAIAEELNNLRSYKVWRKEKMPKGIIPVRGRFVFKWKPDENNHLERAKARFTMQGCTQIRNLHFKKTYAPTAFIESLRFVIKIGVTCAVDLISHIQM